MGTTNRCTWEDWSEARTEKKIAVFRIRRPRLKQKGRNHATLKWEMTEEGKEKKETTFVLDALEETTDVQGGT